MIEEFNHLQTKANQILGVHSNSPVFATSFEHVDGKTDQLVPHRALTPTNDDLSEFVKELRLALIRHHASGSMLSRDAKNISSCLKEVGYNIDDNAIREEAQVQRFPTADKTKKGNLAEVVLAEYICVTPEVELPVYRFHFNTNIEQSMKGDDVLAFDFSGANPKIFIGEAKFRKTPSEDGVTSIVKGLESSFKVGLPVSLTFVEDRLDNMGQEEQAERVGSCSEAFRHGDLDLLYVGFFLSNHNAKKNVDEHAISDLENFVMLSMSLKDPQTLINDCFKELETQAHGTSNGEST